MTAKLAILLLGVGIVFSQSGPNSPTNPACYNSPNYRNTHEQECLIDPIHPGSGANQPGGSNDGDGGGLLGGLLHTITGGLL